MSNAPYTHHELVMAVWDKTINERERNVGLAHHDDVSILRCVAMVLTPRSVTTLIALRPELKDQFVRTVEAWRATKNLTATAQGAVDGNQPDEPNV